MHSTAGRPGWAEVLTHPVRTLHTVRHLRPAQITNRAARTLRREGPVQMGDDIALIRRAAVRPADDSAGNAFDGRSFSFLNRRIVCDGADRWEPAAADLLWIYNLHYFRYLWGASPSAASALIADWIDRNTAIDTPGWDAYPISLRVREWIEWLLAHEGLDPTFVRAVVRSIAQQTAILQRRLEFHLMGNHLLENAVTLCWAGLSLDGAPAAWLATGERVLRRELARQVLSDGSHDERSPMYQALLAEALLRLSEVAAKSSAAAAPRIRRAAGEAGVRMLRSLAHLIHPDGHYALLNDAALGVAPSFASLVQRFDGHRSAPLDGHQVWTLPAAGYAGRRTAGGGYLVFDGGPIGPDHQPGHGHADTLSFELSHRGRRVVTDTGVLTYRSGAERSYDRSTAAHNTIEIDDQDQSELWGAFRCARRAVATGMTAEDGRGGTTLSGAYVGPGRRFRPVRHERHLFAGRGVLAFTDTVKAAGERVATLRLHFAPGLQLRQGTRRWSVHDHSPRALAAVVSDGIEWRESASPYHPEFGRELERQTLEARVRFRGRLALKWWLLLN